MHRDRRREEKSQGVSACRALTQKPLHVFQGLVIQDCVHSNFQQTDKGVTTLCQFQCIQCNTTYPADTQAWTCSCGGLFDLVFEGRWDTSAFHKRPPGMWRYLEALPVGDPRAIVRVGERMTPLATVRFQGREIFLKLDYLFPSGSYKDRGAALLASMLKAIGARSILEDSSGNAGAAIATYAARASIACEIFLPSSTSPSKIRQLHMLGAKVHTVEGPREASTRALIERLKPGTIYASHVYNPFFFHGTKTIAYELYEQFGNTLPGHIILPAGNGTILLGLWIAIQELTAWGMIQKMPKLVVVQPEVCAPLYDMIHGLKPKASYRPSIAEGISIAAPSRLKPMIQAIQSTGGEVITVSEEAIEKAWKSSAKEGFLIEPTSATVMAALDQVAPKLAPGGKCVAILTGHGLKALH